MKKITYCTNKDLTPTDHLHLADLLYDICIQERWGNYQIKELYIFVERVVKDYPTRTLITYYDKERIIDNSFFYLGTVTLYDKQQSNHYTTNINYLT